MPADGWPFRPAARTGGSPGDQPSPPPAGSQPPRPAFPGPTPWAGRPGRTNAGPDGSGPAPDGRSRTPRKGAPAPGRRAAPGRPTAPGVACPYQGAPQTGPLAGTAGSTTA